MLAEERDGCTLDEVATALGVSRQRAHQIETRALNKLRAWSQRRGIKAEDLIDVSTTLDNKATLDNPTNETQ